MTPRDTTPAVDRSIAGEASFCGDGVTEDTEVCDTAGTLETECAYGLTACEVCNETCALVPGNVHVCGDGFTDPDTDEQCDDGNNIDTDLCTNACRNATCGDGIRSPYEGCDDGNDDNDDGCLSTCALETCGTVVGAFGNVAFGLEVETQSLREV